LDVRVSDFDAFVAGWAKGKSKDKRKGRQNKGGKMQTFTYSDAGIELTKGFEGLRLAAYRDCAGVLTIGYGHTGPDVVEGKTIDEAEAEALLRADLQTAVDCVNRAVTAAISQNQFDALVDFCFNVGCGAFEKSTLLRKVNAGDFAGAAAQFALWVHAGGEVVAGLVRRRKMEAEMFVGLTPRVPAV
jgi:lysozyme